MWERTVELCTSRPRFEAKADYPMRMIYEETFPEKYQDYVEEEELGEDFRADSEDPDSVIIQADIANVCTAPSDYTKLVFADVIDELSRKGIVVHTSEKPRWMFLTAANGWQGW